MTRQFIEYLVWAKEKWPNPPRKMEPAGVIVIRDHEQIGKKICLHAIKYLIKTHGSADMDALELLISKA